MDGCRGSSTAEAEACLVWPREAAFSGPEAVGGADGMVVMSGDRVDSGTVARAAWASSSEVVDRRRLTSPPGGLGGSGGGMVDSI